MEGATIFEELLWMIQFCSGQCPQKLLNKFFHWRFERWEPALSFCVFVGRPQEEKQKPGQNQGMNMINSCHHLRYLILPEVRYVYFLPLENALDWKCSWFIYTRWHDLKISTWITKNLHLNLSKNAKEICQIWGFFLLVKKDVAPGDLVSVAFASGQHRDICGSRWVPPGQR